MTAEVSTVDGVGVRHVRVSSGTWADAHYSFGEMLARASADVRLRPGDLIGSGTVGTGCLLEVKDETLGRYLEPGDDVVLRIDRLGELRTPIVERRA
jgi:fumarylacetoacetate (FAA) hydrolase